MSKTSAPFFPASVRATLVGGVSAPHPMPNASAGPSPRATSAEAPTENEEDHTASTLGASVQATQGRTTVLPRRRKHLAEGDAADPRTRFDHVRVLGRGAMGEVQLVRDNDIRRTVAVKRLLGKELSAVEALRFADVIRMVGQREHPGIVPIYDVGHDEDGQVYLVMKHLQGETMEGIVSRLRSGDREYHV